MRDKLKSAPEAVATPLATNAFAAIEKLSWYVKSYKWFLNLLK
jgi:hypothetical protein